MTLLEVNGLHAWYGESHILHGVDLFVEEGETICILGRNGMGKTTTLRTIMGILRKRTGAIRFAGKDMMGVPLHRTAREGLGFVPEDRRIFTHITVEENIELGRFGATAARPVVPAAQIYEWFPMLGPLRARLGGQLSGGQQQMLAVARAVAARPRLLLLDEPTEGLAPVIVEDLAKIVARICDELGITLLLVEQNIWFGRQTTDRVYVLDTGSVVFSGSWAEFDRDETIRNRHLALA